MNCEEFPPVSYDLYVLGLLNEGETQTINRHVESECATCISGVRRSMRLWGVFTSTLATAEPSSHFKERLKEIVGLSKSVLTFPKDAVVESRDHLPKWAQVAIAITIAAMLTVCGWYAGHASGSVDNQQLVSRVTESEQELSSSRLEVQRKQQQADRYSAALTVAGQADAVTRLANAQDSLRRMEAELAQYKALLGRNQRIEDQRRDLLLLLSSPSARLFTLQGSQSSPGSLGYVLAVPNSKLVLVASNLNDLPNGREYQLWIIRKSAQMPTSAGVFVPDETGHAYLQLDEGDVVSVPEGFAVTDEPPGGSRAPSGSKFLISQD